MKTHAPADVQQQQDLSEGGVSMTPPAFQLLASPAEPPADASGQVPIQRVVAPEDEETFTAFGNAHRNRDLDPDSLDEDAGGIHRIDGREEGARPEDAPTAAAFRIRFHKLHSAKLYMEERHPDLLARVPAELGFDPKALLFELSGAVKTASKDHKKATKDLGTDTSMEDLTAAYEAQLDALGARALEAAERMQAFINANSEDAADMDAIHADGTEIWRDNWHRVIMAVNTVLQEKWPIWLARLQDWTRQRRDADGLAYMNPDAINGLDYIGSLAKGYKGPPKQGVRFMPEKFDVDANLDAPPLAAFAIQETGAMVDRGRIWSRDAGIQPILDMEADIQARLVERGLLDMGMAEDEPFEAVIDTTTVGSIEEAGGIDGAMGTIRMVERTQALKDAVIWLRHHDMDLFGIISHVMEGEGLAQLDADGHLNLKDNDEEAGTYAFSPEELDRMEGILAHHHVPLA